ncbi:MAG TPA: hydroxymethylbilane synthase [Thermoanaerobaculia bacterium]|nr:hydroxymethylbilane synthase [Thermoanaerobaculia bacterium]
MKLRIGARGSALSLAQTRLVAAALSAHADVEIISIRTTGDRLSRLEAEMTGKDLFTREIDEALLEGRVDLGVHSLKDLPSRLPEGLCLAAVPAREDPSDVLVSRDGSTLDALPRGVRVGTSSSRRRAQILAARPDAEVLEARGNVDTRIRRLKEGRWDAVVLARAGLARLGRLDEVTQVLPASVMLPAIGQGALAVVTRADDAAVREEAARLDDLASHREVLAERALLDLLEAGCRAPVAGLARVRDGGLLLSGAVFAPDGSRTLRGEAGGSADDAEAIGREVATRLLEQGAADLIALARA